MAAYSRVYDSRHLQADCQEPASAPKPYARQSTLVQLFVERGKLCSFVTFSVNDNRYYFHQNHHSPRQWWYKWAQVNAYIAYFLQYISHLLTMIIEFLPRLNWEMLLKHVNSAAINTQFSRIVLIGTHVKPMSADTSVGVQSKMHHLFVEVVSRHTKIIN